MSDVTLPTASEGGEKPDNNSNRTGRRFFSVLVALSLLILVQLHAEKVGMASAAEEGIQSGVSLPNIDNHLVTANTDTSKSFKLPEACKSEPNCRNRFVPNVGYPRVAFDGFIGELVCPSMFRDLTDYVLTWPFAHFEEDVYFAESLSTAKKCLAPVPLIYWQTVSNKNKIRELHQMLQDFGEFILLTGQSDSPVDKDYESILALPNLVRWFGQNNNKIPLHPKFTPIPIGLNCFEHGNALETFIAQREEVRKKEDKVFYVNFSLSTNGGREKVRSQFCEGNLKEYTDCISWGGLKNIKDVKLSTEIDNLKSIEKYMFVVSPRGAGESTHRTWQSLYAGTIPIVKRSPIDHALEMLPVHLVDDYSDITPDKVEELKELYRTKYKPMMDDPEVQKVRNKA